MPSSIPYDPSLVLGNLVHPDRIKNLKEMSDIQAEADAAQEHMNALVSAKRSLDMTKNEFRNMGIDEEKISKIDGKLKNLDDQIIKAAGEYLDAKLGVEDKLVPYRSKIGEVDYAPESAVDFVRTEIKSMPLSTRSTWTCSISRSTSTSRITTATPRPSRRTSTSPCRCWATTSRAR